MSRPGSARRPQARSQRTRQHIIEVAAAAFAEHGYEGVALNDIVRRSGLTKGAFYFHFGSKDKLALAAFRSKQGQLISQLAPITGPDQDGLDGLSALLRRRAELVAADPSLRCVTRLGADLMTRSGPGSVYEAFQELALDLLADLLERGQRQGSIRVDLDPRRGAETVFATILGIDLFSGLVSGGQDLPARSEDLIALLTIALAAPARGRPQSLHSTPSLTKGNHHD